MSKSKSLEVLGAVIKTYDSGNVETNKGFIVQGKYNIGDVLLLEEDSRKVYVQEKKTGGGKANKKDKKEKKEEKEDMEIDQQPSLLEPENKKTGGGKNV